MDFVMTSCLNTLRGGWLGQDGVTASGPPGMGDGGAPGPLGRMKTLGQGSRAHSLSSLVVVDVSGP